MNPIFKILLYSNLFLTIALITIFIFDRMGVIQHLSQDEVDTLRIKQVNGTIAFFYMDTIELKANYIKQIKKDVRKIIAKHEIELNNLGKLYLSYRGDLKKGKQSKTLQEELKILEEKYHLLKIQQRQKIEHLYSRYDIITKKNLRDIMDSYRKRKGLQFIYSYEDGFMYSVNSALDITDDIIQLFNNDFIENPHKYPFFN